MNKKIILGILLFSLLSIVGCGNNDNDVFSDEGSAMPSSGQENVQEMRVDHHEDDTHDDNDEHQEGMKSGDDMMPDESDESNSRSDTSAPPREIEMIARNWEFIPDTIRVKQGETVELHIQSVDVKHGLTVPELGINLELLPKRDEHVTFTADKKGEFGFFCSVPCGRGHGGMRGQIIVE